MKYVYVKNQLVANFQSVRAQFSHKEFGILCQNNWAIFKFNLESLLYL